MTFVNIKITDLPSVANSSDIASTDVLPLVDISEDTTKKVTAEQLAGFVNDNITVGLDQLEQVTGPVFIGREIAGLPSGSVSALSISQAKNMIGNYNGATNGLVPNPPSAGSATKFLRGDGQWSQPTFSETQLSLATNISDILNVSNHLISADDAGSDKLIFWDESLNKLRYLSIGTGLQIDDTILNVNIAGGSTYTGVTPINVNSITNQISFPSWPGTDSFGYLKNDGAGNLSWDSAPAGGGSSATAADPVNSVQFNGGPAGAGVLNGTSNFTWLGNNGLNITGSIRALYAKAISGFNEGGVFAATNFSSIYQKNRVIVGLETIDNVAEIITQPSELRFSVFANSSIGANDRATKLTVEEDRVSISGSQNTNLLNIKSSDISEMVNISGNVLAAGFKAITGEFNNPDGNVVLSSNGTSGFGGLAGTSVTISTSAGVFSGGNIILQPAYTPGAAGQVRMESDAYVEKKLRVDNNLLIKPDANDVSWRVVNIPITSVKMLQIGTSIDNSDLIIPMPIANGAFARKIIGEAWEASRKYLCLTEVTHMLGPNPRLRKLFIEINTIRANPYNKTFRFLFVDSQGTKLGIDAPTITTSNLNWDTFTESTLINRSSNSGTTSTTITYGGSGASLELTKNGNPLTTTDRIFLAWTAQEYDTAELETGLTNGLHEWGVVSIGLEVGNANTSEPLWAINP